MWKCAEWETIYHQIIAELASKLFIRYSHFKFIEWHIGMKIK